MQKNLLSKEFSCVKTSQQNNVVERKHLHILNVARFFMFQSNILVQFWHVLKLLFFLWIVHLVQIWVINLLMRYYLPNCLITFLRTFDTFCYVSTFLSHIHSPMAIATVFIGYPPGYIKLISCLILILNKFLSLEMLSFMNIFFL